MSAATIGQALLTLCALGMVAVLVALAVIAWSSRDRRGRGTGGRWDGGS